MAVTNMIPPQAYTRDVLVKAIEWIGTQPSTVREKATSADLLVSFYMQACRRASANMEAPVSQENFKTDLKNLAQGLKAFEDPAPPASTPNRFASYGVEPIFRHDVPMAEPVYAPPPPVPPPPPPQAPTPAPVSRHQAQQGPQWTIDPRSLSAARELQQRLNFASEQDAIRFLVTLGCERARELFP